MDETKVILIKRHSDIQKESMVYNIVMMTDSSNGTESHIDNRRFRSVLPSVKR